MGGSASRTSGDQSSTDPGGGFRQKKQQKSEWNQPRGDSKRDHWSADSQEFPSLEAQWTAGDTKRSTGPSTTEVDRLPTGHQTPVLRNLDRGMRPAKDIQPVLRGNRNARPRGDHSDPLSALAEKFTPRKISGIQSTPHAPTDNELDRSLAKTDAIKVETPPDVIKSEIATIGTADPTETDKPVAMADVAEPSGPAVAGAGAPVIAGTRFLAVAEITGAGGPKKTGAGGPVMTGTRFRTFTHVVEASRPTGAGGPVLTGNRFRAVPDVAGASSPAGTGAGGPVIAGTQFLAVAEVYAPFEETRGDVQGDIGRVDQISKISDEKTGSHPLKHSGGVEWTDISKDIRKRNIPEGYTDPTPVQGTRDEEPIGYSTHSDSPNEWGEPLITDGTEDTEDEDAIMVGVVGSAAPWFLTGWTNDVEVEFMIDTSCQVTILATSVFEKMCKVHPQVKDRLSPCTCRLVSADSSPLTVIGRINLNVVFPGLQCNMCCVVANIGSDGLLGTEALQSCLPHQLDLQTGQLWAHMFTV